MLTRTGIALMVLALLVSAAGTGGFGVNTAERDVTVDVVDDDDAYIGYQSPAKLAVQNGDETTLVTVTNNQQSDISLTGIDVTVDGPKAAQLEIDPVSVPQTIGVGNSGDIRAEISCQDPVDNREVQITLGVDGPTVDATVFGDSQTRTISVDCEPKAEITAVLFMGSGNTEIQTTHDTTAHVELLLLDSSGGVKLDSQTVSLETNRQIRGQLGGLDGQRIVAVAREGTGDWYVHPDFVEADCAVGQPANGGKVDLTEDKPQCQ